ncbi:palmitoleoyl-protein carboxylesterase NOTUM [Onthophagus taurus]|uniref:palmitoleoyl-protein carboxylesterase NOTUM n=1 Tax=Onthophagus taurus TaxID=166361 RepID=UPI000C204FC8|nr:palmitoleoyl-protein carboxylesterase NOTUM [Onthophagus taurus]
MEMILFVQITILQLALCSTVPTISNRADLNNTIIKTELTNVTTENRTQNEAKALKKVYLSNRTITCNDGSQSGFYLRRSHLSKKWIVFLEGGWYCYDHPSCQNRWVKQRHYMTSSQWPETRDVGGILSPNQEENPFWWNANHVFIPYCTSDSWSGTRIERNEGGMFNFMGSLIVQQVIRDLIPLGLENSTDVLLAGSSAGGTGVMLNLDLIQEILHDKMGLKHIAVRGVSDSGWFLDRIPFSTGGKLNMSAIEKGMDIWRGNIPDACKIEHPNEPWKCYFGYKLYPTLKAPLFLFQWLFDEAQMDADNVGAPVTKQQWDYIHKMGNAIRKSFKNVSAVFAPSCISHSVLTKRDWLQVKIDGVSIAEALHCWETIPIRKYNHNNNMKRSRNHHHKEPKIVPRQVKRIDNEETRKIRRRKHRGNRKPKIKKNRKNCGIKLKCHQLKHQQQSNFSPFDHNRSERSAHHNQKQHQRRPSHCHHRRLEKCSWPQCNRSCPKLHNPYTGEEMDFIELLKSFGLDMESVAHALGIDMQTLISMDHTELLNLLTQQAS